MDEMEQYREEKEHCEEEELRKEEESHEEDLLIEVWVRDNRKDKKHGK